MVSGLFPPHGTFYGRHPPKRTMLLSLCFFQFSKASECGEDIIAGIVDEGLKSEIRPSIFPGRKIVVNKNKWFHQKNWVKKLNEKSYFRNQ